MSSFKSRYFGQLVPAAVAAAIAVLSAPAAIQGQDGGGNAAIPISSFDELCLIGADAGHPLDGDYELTADISASDSRDLDGGAGFSPIGRRVVLVQGGFGVPDVVDSTKAFTGTFDGKGYKISGLYIRRTGADAANSGSNIGLFGFACGARIRGLTVVADTIVGYRHVGAVVGRQSGGVTEGCVAAGAVLGDADVGGLVGALEGKGEVKACYSSAVVSGMAAGVIAIGGLAGSADDAAITECYSIGAVNTAYGNRVGGLVGSLTNLAKVSSCYSVAAVDGGSASAVGGFVGENDASEIRQCYSAGVVRGGDAGGLIGVGSGTALHSFWDTERSGRIASVDGGTGRTTAQMMDTVPAASTVRNLVAAAPASWGIANNYPYLKSSAFPLYTVTATAKQGGTLSGVTTLSGTVHTQKTNYWIGGKTIVANIDTAIADGFAGWYLTGTDTKLAADSSYDGFSVAEISDSGSALSLAGLSADVNIEARFILRKHKLRYIARSGRGKIVSQDGGGEYFGDTLVMTAEHGTVASVTAVPNTGCDFLEWIDDKSAEKPKAPARADTALSDRTFSAYFTAPTVTLAYTAGENGKLRVRVNNAAKDTTTYTAKPPYGSNGPRVEAVPDQYYHFVTWSDDVTDNPRIDSAATENVDAVAVFSNTYKITYIAGPGGRIAKTHGTEVDSLSLADTVDTVSVTITVSATPLITPGVFAVADSGFLFVKWSDGVTNSSRNDASARSDSTIFAIFEKAPIAVKSIDRAIPVAQPSNETAQVRPIKITAERLTAGPNPVSRQSGKVDLYWQGANITGGTLLIFDASGNFVNKISVGNIGNNTNATNKHRIATWSLTDANGKLLGSGTYLIKGTLLTKNGIHDKISLILILI